MRGLFFLFISFFLLQVSYAQLLTVDDKEWQLYAYCVQRANEITIDGKNEEAAWAHAETIPAFSLRNGHQLTDLHQTEVSILHDDSTIYFYVKLYEDHVHALLTQRDDDIYFDNAIEFFIDADGDGNNYVELQLNALGVICDLQLDRPYRSRGKADKSYAFADLQYAIRIEGTCNDPSDTDEFWAVEVAIPKKALGAQLSPNAPWRMNFARTHWRHEIADGNYFHPDKKPRYSTWAIPYSSSLHKPEKWGQIYFDQIVPRTTQVDFKFSAKLLAYDLYEQLRRKKVRQRLPGAVHYIQIEFRGHQYLYSFQIDDKQYTITIHHKNKKPICRIDEMGNISVLESESE